MRAKKKKIRFFFFSFKKSVGAKRRERDVFPATFFSFSNAERNERKSGAVFFFACFFFSPTMRETMTKTRVCLIGYSRHPTSVQNATISHHLSLRVKKKNRNMHLETSSGVPKTTFRDKLPQSLPGLVVFIPLKSVGCFETDADVELCVVLY